MLEISHRGQEMPSSPIRKLVPYAEAAKKKGIHVFHLNIGQPDIETPAVMLNAVRNADIRTLEYSHSAGNTTKIKVGFNAASEGPFDRTITIFYKTDQTKVLRIKGEVWKAPAGAAPANASVQFLKQQLL